jgi:hypothetical protein
VDKMDLVTLAIPRPCAPEMLRLLILHCQDYANYEWRWIVNVDRVEGLEKVYDYETVCQSIVKAAEDAKIPLILHRNETNIGHAASYRKVMEHVEGDFLYLEDDKFTQKNFTIKQLKDYNIDQLDIEFPHNKIGHTGGHYGSAKYAAHVKSIWPKDLVPEATAESYMKSWFFNHPDHGFKSGKIRGVVLDMGSGYLRANNVYRRWQNRLNLMYYVSGPKCWLVTWAPTTESAKHFLNYAVSRLSLFHSFPVERAIIYSPVPADDSLHPYTDRIVHADSLEDAKKKALELDGGNVVYVQWSMTLPDKWQSETFNVIELVNGEDPRKLHCGYRPDAEGILHEVLRREDDQHNNTDTVKK